MKSNDWWFILGGVLVLVGVLLQISNFWLAPYIYSAGALSVLILRVLFPIKGDNYRIKRLKRIQFFSCALLILGAYFMFQKNNTWAICLFLAALFDLLVVYRLPKDAE